MPHFLHIGPARCATTWQARVYSQHPQLHVPRSKDTEFFSSQYGRDESWYRSQFHRALPHQRTGELCHRYFWHPAVPARAYQFNPHFAVILTLRDPWLRLLSAFQYDRTLYFPHTGTLMDYLRLPVVRQTIDYAGNIRRWREIFPAEQLLLTYYEEIALSPREWLKPIWRHLKVHEHWDERWSTPCWQARQVRFEPFAHFAFSVSQLLRRFGYFQLVGVTKEQSWLEPLLYRQGHNELGVAAKDLELAAQVMQKVYQNWQQQIGPLPSHWSQPL